MNNSANIESERGATPLETMARTLEEWAAGAGEDALTPFDGDGVALVRFGDGLEASLAVRGEVYASAVAGTLAGCADGAKVCAGLLEAHFLWSDLGGFTFALAPDGETVEVQDRRSAEWFGDGEGFAAYLERYEDAIRTVQGFLAYNKEEA